MTWTKFGTEFFKECIHYGLTDTMVRTHAEAIGYLYDVEEMSLRIPKRSIRLFTGSDDSAEAIELLVALNWWADRGDAYEVIHHADVVRQSLAAQAKQRETSKKTSAKYRANKAVSADDGADVSADQPPKVTRHVTDHADRQTDRLLRPGNKTTCKHGVPNGQTHEPWAKEAGQLVCSDCTRERRGA